MKIMVTGDRGYIGTVLVSMLKRKGHEVVGYDSGYFAENLLEEFDDDYAKITKDIRDIKKKMWRELMLSSIWLDFPMIL